MLFGCKGNWVTHLCAKRPLSCKLGIAPLAWETAARGYNTRTDITAALAVMVLIVRFTPSRVTWKGVSVKDCLDQAGLLASLGVLT